ncbi:hypothetical protein H5410_015505 [Solanum commersonii]|uniref:Ribulose bisphosphate carboxylase/oxygenase activase AAA helical domain-containing protein n=1 Tax=Solanum commersonii TaxID=4109 RepID=A0A9J5ZTY3_SOLCO|nr:hypothetical protein H5410_015505 [Solanum commersonii]
MVTKIFSALRARIYDDEVRKWVLGTGIEAIEEKLLNSREGPPNFDQQKIPLRSSLGMGRDMIIVILLEVCNDSTSRGDVFHFYNFFEAICKGSYSRTKGPMLTLLAADAPKALTLGLLARTTNVPSPTFNMLPLFLGGALTEWMGALL